MMTEDRKEHLWRVTFMFLALLILGMWHACDKTPAPTAPTDEQTGALLDNSSQLQDMGQLHTNVMNNWYHEAYGLFVEYQGEAPNKMWDRWEAAFEGQYKFGFPDSPKDAQQFVDEARRHPLYRPVLRAFTRAFAERWRPETLRQELQRLELPDYVVSVGVSSYEFQLHPPDALPMMNSDEATMVGAVDAISAAIGGPGAPLTAPAGSAAALGLCLIHHWMTN